jgi:hypothetical protein
MERDMAATAQRDNDFLEVVVGYLDLLHRQGIIRDPANIETEIVIRVTEELRDYFETLHANDAE